MEVRMELSRILISDDSPTQLIFLSEPGGGRCFPIEIGTVEAYAIDRRLKGIPTPRPMTHDLLAGVIEALGATMEKIVIDDLRYDLDDGTGTFIATIHLRRDGQAVTVDSRPSDAIALGAAFNTPIFVAQRVLDDAAKNFTPEERIAILRKRMRILSERIDGFKARLADKEFLASTPAEELEQYRLQVRHMQREHDAIRQVIEKLA